MGRKTRSRGFFRVEDGVQMSTSAGGRGRLHYEMLDFHNATLDENNLITLDKHRGVKDV